MYFPQEAPDLFYDSILNPHHGLLMGECRCRGGGGGGGGLKFSVCGNNIFRQKKVVKANHCNRKGSCCAITHARRWFSAAGAAGNQDILQTWV